MKMKRKTKLVVAATVVGAGWLGIENGWFATDEDKAKFATTLTAQIDGAMVGTNFDLTKFGSLESDTIYAPDDSQDVKETIEGAINMVQGRAGWTGNVSDRQREIAACSIAVVTLQNIGRTISNETMKLYAAEGQDVAASNQCITEIANLAVSQEVKRVHYVDQLAG